MTHFIKLSSINRILGFPVLAPYKYVVAVNKRNLPNNVSYTIKNPDDTIETHEAVESPKTIDLSYEFRESK